MKMIRSMKMVFLAIYLSLIITVGIVQAQSEEGYNPEVGQRGKDVIWVPTPQGLVDKMLDMAKVTPTDYVIDLGSGDGRIVIAAAKRGARAHGIEYNPDMVELSRRNAAKEGVSDKATFAEADLFESDLSQATVITMFLLQDLNIQLRPKILNLKPGTRIVSNSFDMREWEADEIGTADKDCSGFCTAYLWIVPANVAGTWRLAKGELTLEQNFQMITGALISGDDNTPVRGRLNGDQISFTADGRDYIGHVTGNLMSGTVKGGRSSRWSAIRISDADL
jgi:SAM-dependent methyltransferase